MTSAQNGPKNRNIRFHGRRKTPEGRTTLRWVYLQKFQSMRCPSRKGLRGATKPKMQFGSFCSLYSSGVNNYISAELSQ